MKRLTVKEANLVQLVARGKKKKDAYYQAGYSPKANPETARVEAYKTLQKPHVRSALEKALEIHDITLENALLPISKGLKAKYLVENSGKKKVYRDNLDLQLRASDRALKLLGVTQGEQQGSFHLHLHSKLNNYEV